MWDILRPGIEPVSLALAGRVLTTGPPRNFLVFIYVAVNIYCQVLVVILGGGNSLFS